MYELRFPVALLVENLEHVEAELRGSVSRPISDELRGSLTRPHRLDPSIPTEARKPIGLRASSSFRRSSNPQGTTVATVIIGARNETQLKQNLAAADWNLTPEQVAKLDAASKLQTPYPYWHQRQFLALNPPPVPE